MDAYEIDIANWLRVNGIDGDAGAAKALTSALQMPGRYGAIAVARTADGYTLTGPATSLTVSGSEDIQALRMRLDEILTHPGQPST